MLEVQQRTVGEVERLRRQFPEQRLALFSHGDPIRSILLYYLGLPLDLLFRLEIGTASISHFQVNDWGARIYGLNLNA